jgi:hypothetical protein
MGKLNYVAKLDVKSKFSNVKTMIKTEDELKEVMGVHFPKYVTIWNLVKPSSPRSDITFIGKQISLVVKKICGHYADSPDSTKVSMMSALANILLAIDKIKFNHIVRHLFVEAKNLQKKVVIQNKDNKLSDRDVMNVVCFEDLEKQLENIWNFTQAHPNYRQRRYILMGLILALNTLIPPMRLDWLDVRFTKRKPPKKSQQNWLYEKRKGQYVLVLNHDKVSGRIGGLTYDLKDDIPSITDGDRLNKMIMKSLEWWPRSYVLEGEKSGKPLRVSTYNSALSACFLPKRPTQNLIRKIYINSMYSKNLSENVKEQIAKRMRHSTAIANTAYRKVDMENVCEVQNYEPITYRAPQPIVPKIDYFDKKAYQKSYRELHKVELKEKREKLKQNKSAIELT